MLFICCLIAGKIFSQVGANVVDSLVQMGFENVGCSEDDRERVYVLQNSAYRLQGVGIGKAVDIIQKVGMPESKPCRIIVLNNNVPQISLYYKPTETDSLQCVERKDWKVSYDLDGTWNQARKIKLKNSSLFKVDLVVYPQLAFKNLIINQIYQVLFQLSPAIEVSLWKGMKMTAQVKFPIYNDGYRYYEEKIHPGHVTVSQRFRLPYNIFGKLTVGTFNVGYGVDLDLFYPFKDERFSLVGRLGYTGIGVWDSFVYHYDDKTMMWTWTIGGNFYWPRYNTQFTLKAERYLEKDIAVKFEMVRHFRYCSVGFYAMKGQVAKTNGGFRFQVALPPYKYKRYKKSWPRINTSANMGIVYNANNEQKYYREYKSEASDNIMEKNSFNPYFIKSELLNF